jgi:carboxymethylenebutenolidase
METIQPGSQKLQTSNEALILGTTPVYHARPDDGQKHPGLVVIHEIWGLAPHIKDVANRFAAEGYSVWAPDLFQDTPIEGKIDAALMEEMNNPETRDEAQKKLRAFFAPTQSPEFGKQTVVTLKTCLDHLLKNEGVNGEAGVLGFCFGGTYSFQLAIQDPRVKAAVAFYGQPPKAEDIPRLHSPVLAFYGDQDAHLMQSLPELEEEMKKNGKAFEAVVYPGVGHAFFNDMNTRMYNQDAAHSAWNKTLQFLSKNLRR